MKIIDRYLSLLFLKVFFLSISGIIALYLVIDILEKLDDFLPFHPGMTALVKYFIFKIPLIIVQTTPATILISTVICLGILSRNNEIVAMQTSGIGLLRIFAPVLFVTLFVTAITFCLSEVIVPYTNKRLKYVKIVEIEGKKPIAIFKKNKIWFKGKDTGKDTIYNIRFIDLEKNLLKGFTIFYFNKDFDLVKRIDAKEARWVDESWFLSFGVEREFVRGKILKTVSFEAKKLSIPETIDSFKIVERESTEMSIGELKEYIKRMEMEGSDATKFRVDFHSKISFPVVTVIMAFLGVPFALRASRFGGIPLCIAVSLILGFFFWLIIAITISLGHGGALPPVLAAWLPILIFTLLGSYLFITVHY